MLNHKRRFESWLPALFDGQFHWDFLDPAWTDTKIKPMDHDAVIERNGHFLVFETKMPGKAIDLGQRITLERRWERGETIFILSGKSPEDIEAYQLCRESMYKPNVLGNFLENGDAYDVLYHSRRWFCWASGLPIPNREEWDNQLWLWDYNRELKDG